MQDLDKLAVIEQNKYIPFKSVVTVYKTDDNGKRKFFDGLVTNVTNRGIFIAPLKEDGGECLDNLAASFVPFRLFCDKFDIQLLKLRH